VKSSQKMKKEEQKKTDWTCFHFGGYYLQ